MTTIGVLARPDLQEAGTVLRELIGWLQKRGVGTCLDEATARLAGDVAAGTCRVTAARELAEKADAVVVLGGDGTLLAASRVLERAVPILGVNFGSLGFLTEITLPELFPTLQQVVDGRYEYQERRLLRAAVGRAGQTRFSTDVLNDVVVTKAGASRIIQLDVTVNGVFVSAFRADGLIVSSPTGSTAYNLAAGGPILHPTLPAIVLTPICPHTLTNRPLVVGDEATIEVRLRASRDMDVQATFDGQQNVPLTEEDVVKVTGGPRRLRLVKPSGRDYYEVLRTKLKWGDAPGVRGGGS